MDNYNFNNKISRKGTHSAKWESTSDALPMPLIPLSVADMDIPLPNKTINLLNEFTNKGIYGYTLLSENWGETVTQWMQRHCHWHINAEHVVFCPRVIQAVSLYI